MKFSVLISVYSKENPEYFRFCLESLNNQTLKADECVIVEDGPIGDDLSKVIDEYRKKQNIKSVKLPKNVGLGLALKEGVINCSNELIARMDSDDYAVSNRFELQVNEFLKDPDLDICGSHIYEFENSIEEIIAERKVPLEQKEIIEYQKKRSAFNHMTVMFKKSAVLKAGNYEHCPLMEDDMLWVRMIMSNAKMKNIDDFLVYARTNEAMIDRRGGFAYFRKYRRAKKQIRKTKFISAFTCFKCNFVQFFVSLMPKRLRRFVFFHLLHRKVKQ